MLVMVHAGWGSSIFQVLDEYAIGSIAAEICCSIWGGLVGSTGLVCTAVVCVRMQLDLS
jgi:hypothetical protein